MKEFLEHQKPNGEWVTCEHEMGRCRYPQRIRKEEVVTVKRLSNVEVKRREAIKNFANPYVRKGPIAKRVKTPGEKAEFEAYMKQSEKDAEAKKVAAYETYITERKAYNDRVNQLYQELPPEDHWVIGTFEQGDKISTASVEARLIDAEQNRGDSTSEGYYWAKKNPSNPNRYNGESEESFRKRQPELAEQYFTKPEPTSVIGKLKAWFSSL